MGLQDHARVFDVDGFKAIDQSVLWLLRAGPAAIECGARPALATPSPAHPVLGYQPRAAISAARLADLALDCFPYGSHDRQRRLVGRCPAGCAHRATLPRVSASVLTAMAFPTQSRLARRLLRSGRAPRADRGRDCASRLRVQDQVRASALPDRRVSRARTGVRANRRCSAGMPRSHRSVRYGRVSQNAVNEL